MKRKLALLLTALLVFTTAACSADNSSGQPATSDNAGTESTDGTETAGGEKETEKNVGRMPLRRLRHRISREGGQLVLQTVKLPMTTTA